MRRMIIGKLLVGAIALCMNAANASTDFAGPACTSGCQAVDSLGNGQVVYLGEDPRTYRVCAGNSWTINVSVDGQRVADLDPQYHSSRLCGDFRGKSIVVSGSGSAVALVGAVGSVGP